MKGKIMKYKVLLLGFVLVLAGCGDSDDTSGKGGGKTDGNGLASVPPSPTTGPVRRADGEVREPAVAGLWYPAAPRDLGRLVDGLMSGTVAGVPDKVRAIIAPHASYRYSGITAAVAYKQLMGQDVRTVIVMGPSHTVSFRGASVGLAKQYRTPLGLIPVSPKAAEIAKLSPFTSGPVPNVQAPEWTAQASKLPPPAGKETPHTWEYSVEAQLPFLQLALGGFQLVPIVFGDADPAEAAAVLAKYVDDNTVLVASSDLSHYKPYDVCKSLDAWCLKAVREMDLDAMSQQEACGKGPILTVMHVAKAKGWKPHVVDYRNSGDVKDNPKDKVVGYMGVVFVEEGATKAEALKDDEKKFLLKLARTVITNVVKKQPVPRVDRTNLPPALLRPKGCFVTLDIPTNEKPLRGCIGYTLPIKPLVLAVMETAASAAMRDQRFQPVTPEELDKIVIDISVLTVPKPIYYNTPSDLLKRLRPGIDGVAMEVPVTVRGQRGMARSLYLPSVWKEIPDPAEFMDRLSGKAGLAANAWRQPQARIRTFQVEEFKETKE